MKEFNETRANNNNNNNNNNVINNNNRPKSAVTSSSRGVGSSNDDNNNNNNNNNRNFVSNFNLITSRGAGSAGQAGDFKVNDHFTCYIYVHVDILVYINV